MSYSHDEVVRAEAAMEKYRIADGEIGAALVVVGLERRAGRERGQHSR